MATTLETLELEEKRILESAKMDLFLEVQEEQDQQPIIPVAETEKVLSDPIGMKMTNITVLPVPLEILIPLPITSNFLGVLRISLSSKQMPEILQASCWS